MAEHSDNAEKQMRGAAFKKMVKAQLETLDEVRAIQKRTFRYPDSRQEFGFDFDILLNNDEHWLIQCQTSLGDITQKHEWRAYNIQKIQEMNKESLERVKRYYIVFEDTAEHGSYSLAHRHKAGEIKSVIDGYVSVKEMVETIQEYAFETGERSSGAQYALRGLKKEKYIKQILENPENFRRYFRKENIPGLDYYVYVKILSKLGISCDEAVSSLKAFDNARVIGKLRGANGRPSNAKTDVVLKVIYNDGSEKAYTLSLKRSTGRRKDISVYQTSVPHLCKCIGIGDAKLEEALNHFQECGSGDKLDEKYPKDREIITRRIKPFISEIESCAFSGRGIPCAGEEQYQYADYLVLIGKNEVLIYTIDEYIQILRDMKIERMFGTVFTWSYQGTRGKSIQLNTASLLARIEGKTK
ncbi:MAG: MspI family type II restriction endonuclease [Tyzzerella sp.]|nr:MspI family type II restriction endonuclease [Tyzzerella sp.]